MIMSKNNNDTIHIFYIDKSVDIIYIIKYILIIFICLSFNYHYHYITIISCFTDRMQGYGLTLVNNPKGPLAKLGILGN